MNKWRSRNLKLIVALSALLILLATAPVVSAGRRWSGIDPVLHINDEKINLTVYWPERFTCDIDGIDFKVRAPRGADAEVVEESKGEFPCDDGSIHEIETETKLVYRKGKGKTIAIFARVHADGERFPVRILVARNNAPERACSGWSNKTIRCHIPLK